MKLTTNFRTLTPAFGRDYKTAEDIRKDFLANKDFLLQPESQYCSISDFAKGTIVNLRYKKLTQITTQKVP